MHIVSAVILGITAIVMLPLMFIMTLTFIQIVLQSSKMQYIKYSVWRTAIYTRNKMLVI